jgi:hypothetical protein
MVTQDYQDIIPGELWASPFVTSEDALEPRKVRGDVPSTSIWAAGKAIGGGYYAVVEQHEGSTEPNRLHVYRLSDGRHWLVRSPPGVQPGDVLSIDQETVWYRALSSNFATTSIVRQELAALGAGD